MNWNWEFKNDINYFYSDEKTMEELLELINSKKNKSIKRYFNTNSLTTSLPPEFINSENPRYIHVIQCTLFYDDPTVDNEIETFQAPQFVSMHADFVQDYRALDSFICFCNKELPKRKKFQQFHRAREIKLWFKDHKGEPMDMSKCNFICELMLEY